MGATVIIGVSVIHNEMLSMALLLVACMSFGVYTSSHWAITQTLAGPLAAGRWTSIQNGIGNLAGIAAPWLMVSSSKRPERSILRLLLLGSSRSPAPSCGEWWWARWRWSGGVICTLPMVKSAASG